jgi:hypothetical protein
MSDLTIPLQLSELVYVAFSVVVDELDERTNYPTENLHHTLNAYCKGRDEWLRARGWTDTDRLEITAAATEALTQFLDEQAEKRADEDFDQWAREFDGE